MAMTEILASVVPVIVLLGLGVAAAVVSRTCRLSPIVGYLLLGLHGGSLQSESAAAEGWS